MAISVLLRYNETVVMFQEAMRMEYNLSAISPKDDRTCRQMDALLEQEGIRRDGHLDYMCGLFDEEGNLVATGSCFGNTLRCFAIHHAHQGEGLLNRIVTHLCEVQSSRGNLHLFLYTKVDSSRFFRDLGFHEIARVDDVLSFMENRRRGFSDYLDRLAETKASGTSAAIVMNANPFTLGHQHLAEQAAAHCDRLHIFVLSEDASLVPFDVRMQLVREGTGHLSNAICHASGPYIISNATFPSYFLRDEAAVIRGHAKLDLAVFGRIAAVLGITVRYVGEEPTSQVTGIYNAIMAEELPRIGVECRILPRKALDGMPISASTARKALQSGDWEAFARLVPPTTLAYFQSDAARPVIRRIQSQTDVIHY